MMVIFKYFLSVYLFFSKICWDIFKLLSSFATGVYQIVCGIDISLAKPRYAKWTSCSVTCNNGIDIALEVDT